MTYSPQGQAPSSSPQELSQMEKDDEEKQKCSSHSAPWGMALPVHGVAALSLTQVFICANGTEMMMFKGWCCSCDAEK